MTLPTNLRTASARNAAERLATKLIAANDNTAPKGRESVSRHTRPAMNWSMKHDPFGAACLWMIARTRLPDDTIVANDNEPIEGGLDIRRNGTARGKKKTKASLGSHLDLPPVLPRLGDPEPRPVEPCGYTRIDLLPQNDVDELSDDFVSYGSCSDGVASLGIDFIGAKSGLGTPRPGKSKGDARKVDEHEFDDPPDDINLVIETVLARGDLATVGRAFGAQGRYADKKGAELLRKTMAWAKAQIEAGNFRANRVTNRV